MKFNGVSIEYITEIAVTCVHKLFIDGENVNAYTRCVWKQNGLIMSSFLYRFDLDLVRV